MKPNEREKDVQAAIMEGLSLLGYTCLSTSERRRRTPCPECGARSRYAGGTGVSEGVPDVLVTHAARWPVAAFLGLEIKGTTGTLRPAQKRLLAAGRIAVCRSWEDALRAVQAFEAVIERIEK